MCSVKDRLCCYKQILECIYEPKTIFPQKKVKGTSYIMKVSRRVVRNPAIAFNNRPKKWKKAFEKKSTMAQIKEIS